jgi:stress-induced-phosphoprotein 1
MAECIDTCKRATVRGGEVMAPFALKAKAWARMGNAHQRLGDLAAALEAYDNSLLESHTEEVADKAKAVKAALKKKEAEDYRNPELATKAKDEGNTAFKAGDFPTAVRLYTEAIKRDPDNFVYYANRATARSKLMEFSGALEDCDKALKLNPRYTKALVRRGNIQFLTKEYHKALETLKQALEIEPDNAEAQDTLRKVMMKINEASSSDKPDAERQARAMADPEIQAILRDPMVNAAIEDMGRDPAAARRVLSDPVMAGKLQKLIAAGILSVK